MVVHFVSVVLRNYAGYLEAGCIVLGVIGRWSTRRTSSKLRILVRTFSPPEVLSPTDCLPDGVFSSISADGCEYLRIM